MQKHGLRIALFILSFTIGIGFVGLLNLSNSTRPPCRVIFDDAIVKNDSIRVKTRSGDIEVRFKEFGKTTEGFYADVEVLNPETEPVFYRDSVSNKNELSTIYEPRVKIGGKDAVQMICGTGNTSVEKQLTGSKIYRIYLNVTIHYWEKGKSFQIALYFKKSTDKEYKTYWSENLPITEDLTRQILKEK